MALQVGEAGGGGLGDELGVQLLARGAEGHVHVGPGAGLGGAGEEPGAVDDVVEHLGLAVLDGLHAFHAPLLLQPVQHQAQHVDAPAGRGVVHGVLVDHDLVVQHLGGVGQGAAGQVLPDDDHGETGGGHVLLGPGEDHAVLAHIHRPGEDVGGHVAHQGHAPGVGDVLPLGAVDGVVGAVIEVGRLGVQLQLVLGGDVGVVLVLAGGGQGDLAVFLGLLVGQVGEVSGDGVVGLPRLADEVEGDGGELGGGAALEEEDLVALGDLQQAAELGLGVVKDLLKHL